MGKKGLENTMGKKKDIIRQFKSELNSICNWISANNLMLNSKKLQILIISPNLKSSNVDLNFQSTAGKIVTVL